MESDEALFEWYSGWNIPPSQMETGIFYFRKRKEEKDDADI